MLTKLKKQIQMMLNSEAKLAHRLGFTPNRISLTGFLFALVSAVAYASATAQAPWFLLLGVFFLLASGFSDTMDGIVARTFQQTTVFGGFFDAVLDRYADAAIYAGILLSGLSDVAWGTFWGPILTLSALAGSMMVSYTRARAETCGLKMESVGFAERAERMLILAVASLLGYFWLPALGYGVALLAVLSNITVIQRAWYVYGELKKKAAFVAAG
ncbi:CDP-alcohol phosphatidyltransferase family protein [Candidatus Bathycorpusculum sp.]|uniref:CDP-alcohol phosphatidyltransferase family protein n=1 Tax=Candidatus Bathycorpusculum sp. TaxID=2994959 RepID=UPI00281E4156|nr:CDP-alcohol phosphatidyltransferase family protein [Candidatus Termitimicrobium sp.]MCL2432411.1 CDP-alcohol phosphatidyltransferase family protein [Candidatus Termitimicrobium sp.]